MAAQPFLEHVLLAENAELRARLEEAEEALRAIRAGEVDALVVESADGPKIFTLQGIEAESNRLRGELLAQVGDAVIVTDGEQRLTYLNAAAQRQYGVTAAEVVGLPITELYRPQWLQPGDEAAAQRALGDTGHWRGELKHVLRTGVTLHVDVSATQLRDGTGSGPGPGRLAVVRDITQEHRLRVVAQQREELVRQSEQRLKRVLDQLFVYVGVLDLEGRLLECNAVPLQRAGIQAGDVIGKLFWECHWWLHDRAVADRVRDAVRRAAAGETVRFDACSRFAGELVTCDAQLAPLRDADGRIVNVIASGVDVEARVAAVRELERSEARAVESANRLDALHRMLQATLEAAPMGIALADAQGSMLHFNQAGAELLGIDGTGERRVASASLRGWRRTGTGEEPVPLEPDEWPLQQALAQRRTVTSTLQIAPAADDERRRTVLMSAAPVLDGSGEVTAGVVVQVDITERVDAEAALRRADRQKDEFLATLAHELRNPLAPMRTAVELIHRRDPPDPVVQRARLIIERQVLHLSRLVDDLLDVSRITLGTIQLRQEVLDLRLVAVSALDSVDGTFEAAGLTLEQQLPSSALFVRGDATRLGQCILNLLNNSTKFTPRGGQVKLRVAREGATALVEVTDTGTGIQSANLERIFDLFTQEQPSGHGGNSGLGIGLALTRQLVKLHGGAVHAESAGPGRGSTFRIELPVVEGAVAEGPPNASRVPDAAGARVLIVDDNHDAADTLGEMLALCGFVVGTAYSGEAAVCAVRQEIPDAVLLDIGLPDIDGYEVCRRIRDSGLGRQPIVIALTGWAQDKDRDRATTAGFDGHLTKPAPPDRLISLMQELVAARAVAARE